MSIRGSRPVSVAVCLCGLVVGCCTAGAYGYDQLTHQSIVDQAVAMYNQANPGNEPGKYWMDIRYGAWHEDETDHVFGYWHPFGYGVYATHFWDADWGPLDPVTLAGLTGSYPNAFQKVTGYGCTDWALWQQALGYYSVGDKAGAYERLGHISHLIADMSVPAHVHEDAHAEDYFEDTMERDSGWILQNLDPSQMSAGLIPIPDQYDDTWLDVLLYLMYTTNQRADFFASAPAGEPSAGYWGDALDPAGLVDYSSWDMQMAYYQDPDHVDTPIWVCPVCGQLGAVGGSGHLCLNCGSLTQVADPTAIIAERYTTVYAVRATATLLDYWQREMVPHPVLTGDANGDGQVDGNDLISVEEHFGSVGSAIAGDANHDGQVDGNDLIAVEENFGASSAVVPEPISFTLLACGMIPLTWATRRRRDAR